MNKLTDFQCKHQNGSGFSEEIIKLTGLTFPEAHNDSASLAALALVIKKEKNLPFCMLPFCNTVEAEALGGKIEIGDVRIGPRPKEYAFSAIEDLLLIPPIDFGKGRIRKVLEACSLLKDRGEKVVLAICGPYSIISCLMDLSIFYKSWHRNPELVEKVFAFLAENLVNYCQAACDAGVDIISYADPAGSLKILGPRYSEKTAKLFTIPFLNKAISVADKKCLIHICPKTTLVLKGLDMVEYGAISISDKISYNEAVIMAIGKTDVIGQACLKDNLYSINKNLITVRLKITGIEK